jgi:ketosteroid isomerase-like protein
MTEEPLQQLLDERAIEQALVRFARAMDDRDWDALGEIMAEDVVADLGEGRLAGPAAIIALIRKYLDRCGTTQHLLGNILVAVSGDEATSRAYVFDQHLPASGQSGHTFHTLGDYRDRWQRRGGRWRLVERTKLNRAHVGTLDVFGLEGEGA